MKGQKEYFVRILNTVEKNKEGLRHYFENRPVKFTELKVVETEVARNLMWLNENNTSNFINDTLEDLMKAYSIKSPVKSCIKNLWTIVTQTLMVERDNSINTSLITSRTIWDTRRW